MRSTFASSAVRRVTGAVARRRARCAALPSDGTASARVARVGGAGALLAALLSSSSSASAAARAPSFECAGEYVDAASGLRFCDVVVGDGATPSANDTIEAHYAGRLESGRTFDSSYERGAPLKFKAGQVIKGWGIGILGDGDKVPPMRVGGRRKLVIPAELGYGARGAGGVIPGGATLYFDVELVRVL